MLNIRTAKETDLEAIYALNLALGYEYPLEQTAERLRAVLAMTSQRVIVAEYDGVVAGMVHLEDYEPIHFGPVKNIVAMVVLPEYRRKGIASALLDEAEAWAKETGAVGIRLDSNVTRAPAHACYEKAGYVEQKLHKNFRKLF